MTYPLDWNGRVLTYLVRYKCQHIVPLCFGTLLLKKPGRHTFLITMKGLPILKLFPTKDSKLVKY